MIEIIPAIDLIGGKCVRLTHGDFAQKKVYSDDPVETAKAFAAAGLQRLHIVDLDGARTGTPANINVLEEIASATRAIIDFGGGIRTDADVKRVFDAGAEMVNLGSVAVEEPDTFFEWLEHYGSDSILLGADVRDGKLAIAGWQTETDISVFEFLSECWSRGVEQAFVTDITRDGALGGPSLKLYKEIKMAVPELKLIASGGVSSENDLRDLEQMGCDGAIVGKALYEGKISFDELARYVS